MFSGITTCYDNALALGAGNDAGNDSGNFTGQLRPQMSGVRHIPPGQEGIAASADFPFARAANVENWVVR
jgi:hypothetical protein